jgi:hypothetical protein
MKWKDSGWIDITVSTKYYPARLRTVGPFNIMIEKSVSNIAGGWSISVELPEFEAEFPIPPRGLDPATEEEAKEIVEDFIRFVKNPTDEERALRALKK